jgi:hypothetical protein
MLVKRRDGLAFLLAGLAVTVKQHTFIMIAGMLTASLNFYRGAAVVRNGLILALPFVAFSIPFLLTGNITSYAESVFLPVQVVGYQYPLDYAFSGFLPVQVVGYQYPLDYAFSGTGSLLTHLHNVYGWDTINLLKYAAVLTIVMLVVILTGCYRRRISPLQAALASFLAFTALFYRINYQYLVIYIPVTLLVAAMTKFRGERLMALLLALYPAIWLWLFDVSLWFNYLEPASPWVNPYLKAIGMADRSDPHVYVIYAVTLMCLSLAYIVLVLTKWNAREDVGNRVESEHLQQHLPAEQDP